MKFGVMYDFRNPRAWARPYPELYQNLIDQIVRIEELGFDNVWLTEHHFFEDGYNPALLPTAAAIAARTRRIRIGTFILLLPFHAPVRVAEDVTCVDIISNGRFDLGVGQGYRAEEFAALKIPRPERTARLSEGIDLIRRLWTEASVTFSGRFTQVEELSLYPKPVQRPHPPIWIGARTEKAARRAARMGFHLMATLGPDPAIPYYDELEKLGRDRVQYSVAQLRAVYVSKSADQAWEEAAPHLHYMMQNYGHWLAEANDAAGDKHVWDFARPSDIRNSLVAESLMIGTPAECVRKMEDFRRSYACTHFIMATQLPGAEPRRAQASLELFAKEVMLHFKG